MNPEKNANVVDAPEAFRASPDADTKDERMDLDKMFTKEKDDSVPSLVENGDSDTPLSELSDIETLAKATASPPKASKASKKGGKGETAKAAKATSVEKPAAPAKAKKPDVKEPQFLDPEADGEEEADEEEIKAALSRPPPANSDVLPLPWKGRLGYVSCSMPGLQAHTNLAGMSEYLPSFLQSTRLQLSNLPYRLHPRKPPSSQQPQRTSTRNEEPP